MTSGDPITVWRCETCGNTWPDHVSESPVCPKCGSTDVHQAHEPML